MTRIELISAPASWTMCFSKILFFISLRNFNNLDATSKVVYRHEIICTGNKAYLINNYFGTMQWQPYSGKFMNKANVRVIRNVHKNYPHFRAAI